MEILSNPPMNKGIGRSSLRSSRGGANDKIGIGVTPFRVDAQAKIRRLCEVRASDIISPDPPIYDL